MPYIERISIQVKLKEKEKYIDDIKRSLSYRIGFGITFPSRVFYERYNEKKYRKWELISSHTARRSFCTNAYKDNIPTLAIMAISGHKTEAAFLKYIKADGKEHAEKVLEAWRKSGEFMRVAK